MNKVLRTEITAVLLLGLVCAYVSWNLSMNRSQQTEAQQYASAPVCMAESPASGPGPACQKLPMTIASKEFIEGGRMPDSLLLHLTGDGGRQYSPEVGSLCYARAAVGQHVTAKVWKGKVTVIIYPDRAYQTHSNPNYWVDYQPTGNGLTIFSSTAIVILIMIWYIPTRRSALAERATVPEKSP